MILFDKEVPPLRLRRIVGMTYFILRLFSVTGKQLSEPKSLNLIPTHTIATIEAFRTFLVIQPLFNFKF
jgi:hypothetical protein